MLAILSGIWIGQLKMADGKKLDLGLIAIKPQYVYSEPDEGETPDKKARLDDDGLRTWRASPHENVCRVLVDVPSDVPMPVCSTMRCRYIHDVARYLQTKPPDIGPECYVYKLKGHCTRGITCRFALDHITESGRNKIDQERQKEYETNGPKTFNFYTKEMEADLRKRSYDFRRAEDILNTLPKPSAPSWMVQGDIDFTEDVDVTAEVPVVETRPSDERLGPCPDDDLFKLHMAEKRKITWKGKHFLPALANFGNLPFRRICKEFGVDVTCSEPLVAANLLDGSVFDWLLARRHESEDLFGVQLFGSNPFILTRVAQLLDEKTNADFIDFRYGNPGEPLRFQSKLTMAPSVLRCIARVTSLPITISTRLIDYEDLIDTFKACEVSMICLKGRMTRDVDWEGVSLACKQLDPVPVMPCSDVFTFSEFDALQNSYPEAAGWIVSRGALVKPWIYTELRQKKDWDISSSERFDILQKFVRYGLDHWGTDHKGVELTRRFLLDWLTFLCRYIPIGLLEHPPQKLNDRCPRFVGRDDLETLMGSFDPADWLKISEMLLGPVPDGFQFTPKIRQGYWPLDS